MSETYHIRIEKDHDSKWLVVQCLEHPEAVTQGKTVDECIKNIREALDLVLEEKAERVGKKARLIFELPAAVPA